MRRTTVLFLILLLGSLPAVGDEEEVPLLVGKRITDILVAIHNAGDQAEMKKRAKNDDPDPWLIADALCVRGHYDVALAYAKAGDHPDMAGLPAYLERFGKTPPNVALRRAVFQANEVEDLEDRKVALATLDALEVKGTPMERVLLQHYRGAELEHFKQSAEAAEAELRAGKEAERIGWLSWASNDYYFSGKDARREFNFDGMLLAWSRMLNVEQARGNKKGVARALMLVGNVHAELGDNAGALGFFEQSVAAYEEIDDPKGISFVMRNLAYLHRRRGAVSESLNASERSLAEAQRSGSAWSTAQAQMSLGSVVHILGHFEQALELYEKALKFFEQQERPKQIASCLGNMGTIYASQKRYDKAIEVTTRAVALMRELDDLEYMAAALNNLGTYLDYKGESAEGQRHLEEALAIAKRLRHDWWHVHAVNGLASVHKNLGNFQEAERLQEVGIAIALRMESQGQLMEALKGQAEIFYAQDKYERALHAAERALDTATSLVAGLGQEQAASARENFVGICELAVRSAAKLGRPEELFRAMERARAGTLLDALENRDELRAAEIPEALYEQRREASRKATGAVLKYRAALRGGKVRELRKARVALEGARKQLNDAVTQIQREARAAAQVLYPEAAVLDELQAELESDQAFVLYSLLGEPALALVVLQRDAYIVPLEDRAAIEEALSAPFDDRAVDPGPHVARLRKMLVEPLELPRKARRVMISPDGALGYAPFGLLFTKREVACVPSGTTYGLLLEERTKSGKGILAIGDPDYRNVTDANVKRHRGAALGTLSALPATRAEVDAVGTVKLLGADASEAGLAKAVAKKPRWRAAHFACHGLLDPDRPMFSSLALSADADNDGFLTCGEIFEMKLPADLVVLSACETGKGKIYKTEGIVGLSRAFMFAGAPRVICSLWKVDDEATQALMIKFYELWAGGKGKKGMSPAAALKKAQAYVRSKKKWRHPYYWAAWVLWGLPE